ncbi:MAG: phosphoribosylanthranilate isomerase [Lachnospiraceae bacterium]
MKIKLCGMMRSEDIEYANMAMPDYVGFVFANTRRFVDREKAAGFRKKLNNEIKAAGVYVNETPEQVADDFKQGIVDIAQLHGSEDEEYIKKLRRLAADIVIIKAVRVKNSEDVTKALDYTADYLLFDTYVKGVQGGSGESFNWKLLEGVNRPYFLAGGLNENNIEAAMGTGAYALDLSSGIETKGFKDLKKMLAVTAKIRNNEM